MQKNYFRKKLSPILLQCHPELVEGYLIMPFDKLSVTHLEQC